MELKNPKIRKKKSSSDGYLTVTFDQPMLFNSDWIKATNEND